MKTLYEVCGEYGSPLYGSKSFKTLEEAIEWTIKCMRETFNIDVPRSAFDRYEPESPLAGICIRKVEWVCGYGSKEGEKNEQ